MKPLPPTTIEALNPQPGPVFSHTFFENVAAYPFQPRDTAFNARNAWWLMEAAFLTYSSPETITAEYARDALAATVEFFSGVSTQAYVASTPDWIVLAFRGTQVDAFWPSMLDWAIDARFMPVPDASGHWVHAGFMSALDEVWSEIEASIRALQADARRPFWITGHSLGAALATVAANRFSYDRIGAGLTGLNTYGSPRVGDRGFGADIRVPVRRFRNNTDLVTHVPLGLVFRHVGTLEFIDGGGHCHHDIDPMSELFIEAASLHLSAAQAHQLTGMLELAQPGVPLPGFLADHAPVNYAIRMWNCYDALIHPPTDSPRPA
jgi:hypothetical protein